MPLGTFFTSASKRYERVEVVATIRRERKKALLLGGLEPLDADKEINAWVPRVMVLGEPEDLGDGFFAFNLPRLICDQNNIAWLITVAWPATTQLANRIMREVESGVTIRQEREGSDSGAAAGAGHEAPSLPALDIRQEADPGDS